MNSHFMFNDILKTRINSHKKAWFMLSTQCLPRVDHAFVKANI